MRDPNHMPKISVILPVFNQKAEYLRQSIDSILGQTFKDFEFIIIDDGSTNESSDLLDQLSKKDARILLFKNQKNSGIIYSLNRALGLATGEYIARMDSDDIALPNRLDKQLTFLEDNRDYDLVGSWATVIDSDGHEIGSLAFPKNYLSIRSTIIMRNPVLHPTWMFRRSLIESVGTYNKQAINTEDYEFLLRIAQNHRIANVPEKLLRYRFNISGLSFKNNKEQEKYALIIRIKALRKYGYPIWHSIYLLRPIFFYLFVPSFFKKFLIRFSFKNI